MEYNIVTATFDESHFAITSVLYQYNYGNILVFEGIENLPEYFEVHFANKGDETTRTQIGHDGQVEIPNEYLETGKQIVAYIYLHETAADGETVYKVLIPVRDREEPEDVQPTPEQQSALEAAIYALNTETGVATEAAESAEASATSAAGSATVANNAASSASESATRAQNIIDGAIDNINDAKTAAVQAVRTEGETQTANAKEQADRAEASATAAASSASQASASAVNAGDSASAAATSANAALNAKTAAEQAADSAAQSASNAATSANNANTKAGEAAQSATSARDSAATATQKASEASASATAAAGSATSAGNAASAAAASATAASNAQTAAETAQGKAEDAQEAAETAQGAAEAAAASVSESAAQIAKNTADIASLEEDRYKAFATDTASGAVASFPDGADNIPVKSLVVDVEPVQDLHGYDNPWPAGGGVNLLPPYSLPSATDQGVTLTNNNGEYTLNGTTSSGVAVFDIRINLPAGQYTVALNNPTANSNVQIYGIDENNAVPMQVLCSTSNTTATATFESAVMIFRIRVLRDGTVDNFKLSPVFSAGETAATRFYPYENICPISGWTGAVISHSGTDMSNPETLSITFPTEAGIVYGGLLDVTTGVLTVDMAMVDMGTLSWAYYPNNLRFGVKINGARYSGTGFGFDGACSIYAVSTTSYGIMADKSVVIGCNFLGNTDAAMIVQDSAYTDADVFKTAVSGQKLVYPLATPVTYQLTPTEVTTLLGTNNIWADCGDSTVEYRADTSLYVDKKIAALAAALS